MTQYNQRHRTCLNRAEKNAVTAYSPKPLRENMVEWFAWPGFLSWWCSGSDE